MVGHHSPDSNVCCDELLPRAASVEHPPGTCRRMLLSCVEHTVEESSTTAGQRCGNTGMRWRVNPLLWLTTEHFGDIIDT